MDPFDVAVIGSGPGGYVCAIRAAQLGLRTALVERDETLGGTCLNVGCIPSKVLLESSELFHVTATRGADFGFSVDGVTLDLPAMMARKERIVGELTTGVAGLMKKNKVTVLRGTGSIAAVDRVLVRGPDGDQTIQARNIVLATGSVPVELPFLPFDGERVIDSTGALALTQVPARLAVIGAGAVGLELGSVWARLGAQVTVVEMLKQVTPFADQQVAKALERALKKQGLTIKLKTMVRSATVEPDGVTLQLEGKKTEELVADRVLVAVGRKPYTDGLGLEATGVRLTEHGRIAVDDRLHTGVGGIWAIGDVIDGPMLAHKAEEEGVAVAERIAGKPGHVSYDAVPSVVYTDPELASVGLTQAQAKEQGLEVKIGSFPFRANGRAKALGSEEGMVKIIADAETDRILGAHIVGCRASEMIAELVMALEFRGSAEDVGRIVHAHPTLSEIVKEAALAVSGAAIHA